MPDQKASVDPTATPADADMLPALKSSGGGWLNRNFLLSALVTYIVGKLGNAATRNVGTTPTDNNTSVATTAWVWSLPAQQQIADSTATGGNARGANATDWQSNRTAADRVASGAYAVVGGGQNNKADGNSASIAGGASNTSSGTYGTIGGGQLNTVSATGGTIAGGIGTTCNGPYAWVPGGQYASVRGTTGRGAWASGRFASTGDAQAGEFVLRRQTTDATPTVLTTDGAAPGSANQVSLPDNAAYACRILVVARAGSTGKALWEATALVRRDAGVGSTTVTASPSGAAAPALSGGTVTGWTVTVGADTVNGALAITVTGAAGTAINWVARVLSVETVG